ncbi:MAG: site-specific integrase [Ornithinimicrobium sp.]
MTTSRRPRGDGSIYRASNGKWVGKLYVDDPVTGLTRRVQVTGRTKVETAARVKEMRERSLRGAPARDDAMTLATFATRWLGSTLPASERKDSTKSLYASLTRTHVINSEMGRLPLNRVRPSSVERFLTHLRAKGLAESSVRQIYTVTRAIGDAAVRDGLLADNPLAAIKRPRVSSVESHFLTPSQVQQLISAASGSRYAPMFALLVNTGLRRGEALALRWTDIDLAARTLRVRGTLARIDGELVVTPPKSAKSRRTVPLSGTAVAILEQLEQRTASERDRALNLWADSGFVFTTGFGEPCDPRNALRALKVAADMAGLQNVGLHTLRHSAASVMLTNGVPISVVSEILGHSGISITVDVYGHVAPDVSRDAVTRLSAALDAIPSGTESTIR